VFSDRKIPEPDGQGQIAYYTADVVSYSDYYPFGMVMPGRNFNSSDYRYGFQGMEMDNEVKGNGNSYTTEFRQYDPRLGRWLSVDPLAGQFPWQSPYVAFDNNPINIIDPRGLAGEDPPLQANGNNLVLADGASVGSTFSKDKKYYVTNKDGDKVYVNPAEGSVQSISYNDKTYNAVFNKESGDFVGYKNGDGEYYKDAIKPTITSRSEWGAKATNGTDFTAVNDPVSFYNYIAIHHSGNTDSPTINDVQQEHLDKGWHDIGYHFAVDLQGNIYEGRSINKRGAGAGPADTKAGIIHIVVLGDLQNEGMWEWSNDVLTDEAVKSVTRLSQYLVMKYNIQYTGGHQEIRCNHTQCPGNQMMNKMNQVRQHSCTNPANCVHTDQ
jgi:RHS repeat-associated protein